VEGEQRKLCPYRSYKVCARGDRCGFRIYNKFLTVARRTGMGKSRVIKLNKCNMYIYIIKVRLDATHALMLNEIIIRMGLLGLKIGEGGDDCWLG